MDAAKLRHLISGLTCPVCGGGRQDSLRVVVELAHDTGRVRSQCVRCHVHWSLALAGTQPRSGEGPVRDDEVEAVHQVLEAHRGSLTALIER